MKRTIITAAASLALLIPASPAQAVDFPPAWTCKDAGGGVYDCKASFVIKMPVKAQYVWASKTCRAKVAARANALGAVPQLTWEQVNSGARVVGPGKWRCGAFWRMTVPPTQ